VNDSGLGAVDLGYNQDTYGVIGGINFGKESVFGPYDAFSFGVMVGYLNSTVKFNQNGYTGGYGNSNTTRFNYEGVTAGFTASYLTGGFFFDNLFKADFLSLRFTAPDLGYGHLPKSDVRTLGWIGTFGYRWDIGRLFLEPQGTLAYAKTTIDNLNVAELVGADVKFGSGNSFRGAIGGRVGAEVANWSGRRMEASITGRVWNEFLGDKNSVTLVTDSGNLVLSDRFTKTFGEVKAGVDVFGLPGSWSGFVNAGVKWNNEFYTVTAKGGLSYKWDWR
jgi:outer membrane autotransporter protein